MARSGLLRFLERVLRRPDPRAAGYDVVRRWGAEEQAPDAERLRAIVAELSARDAGHPDTWMTHHDSGWVVAFDEDGFATLSDPDGERVSHLAGVAPDAALAIWIAFARGGPQALADRPWQDGAPRLDPARQAARAAEGAAAFEAMRRRFYDALGEERAAVSCRAPGCARGAIVNSVFCRTHHCEQLWREPCPFVH